MIQTPDNILNRILAPVSANDFYQRYWENQPLHVGRSDSNYFADLLDLKQIDSLLSTHDLFFPDVQLSQSGTTISAPDYTDANNRINPLRLIEFYSAGATIVVSQAHRLLSNLSELTRGLESAFQLRCQTNVYLSPPGNQGFNAHYDTHDVFVLQVSGRKTFTFYTSGVDLPFGHDRFDADRHSAGSTVEEISLNPGDTLYIPRGIMHDGLAHDGADPSLHLTVGIFPVVVHDLLQEIVQIAAEKNVEYRQSVPPHLWLQSDPTPESFQKETLKLLTEAFTTDTLEEALSRLRDNVSIGSKQDSTGLLTRMQQAGQLSLTSTAIVRKGLVLNLERTDTTLKLRTPGQILSFDEPMSSAVEWLSDRHTWVVDELPGLSNEQKVALCHRLWQENIIDLSDIISS